MPFALAYGWAAFGLVLLLRGRIPAGGPSRFVAAGFPLLLVLWIAFTPGADAWFRLPSDPWFQWLGWVCLLGWILAILGRNLLHITRSALADHRLKAQAWRLDSLMGADGLDYPGLVAASGLRSAPPLLGSPDCASPMVVGCWSPAILLPPDWMLAEDDGARTSLRSALAHELAHIAQGDLYRRLLDLSAGLLVPAEAFPVLHRMGGRRGLRRCWGRLAGHAARVEEAQARAFARGERYQGPSWRTRMAELALWVVVPVLLAGSPGTPSLAHSLGLGYTRKGVLPKGWYIAQWAVWKGSYGLEREAGGREAAIQVAVKAGSCALGSQARLDVDQLQGALRLELEQDLESLEGPLPALTRAGFILTGSRGDRSYSYTSWRNPERHDPPEIARDPKTWDPPEALPSGAFRFRNGVALDRIELASVVRFSLEVFLAGRGTFRVRAPRLFVVRADGSRVPYRTSPS